MQTIFSILGIMKKVVLRSALVASISISFIAAVFRLQHWPYTGPLLITSLIVTLLFLLLLVIDIAVIETKNAQLKAIWIAAIIIPPLAIYLMSGATSLVIPLIVGLLYMAFGRKKLMSS